MSKSTMKRELILERAEQVFIRRGFHNVTMKDIIEECAISRGGIYLYFSSVDEIFTEVIKRHNQAKLDQIKLDTKANGQSISFSALLDNYFETQRCRLLNMDHSLMLAQYEFFFAHRNEYDKNYFFSAFHNSKDIVFELLNYGVETGCLTGQNIDTLAETVMFLIEGLGILAMSCGVTEELLDRQFAFIKKAIFTQCVEQ